MSTRNVLRMSFQTSLGRTVSINLLDPVDPLNPVDVGACMDKVIMGDIFSTSHGDIQTKVRAEKISTTTTEVADYS